MPAPRRRLSPRQRREHLLEMGAEVFTAHPYAEVSMAGAAEYAGVSRALLYHYFPGKAEYFAAVYQRAADQLLAGIALESGAGLDEQITAGLDAHIEFFATHPGLVLEANTGEPARDPAVQGIISAELNELRARMLDAYGYTGHERELASAALLAWLEFIRAMCVEWLRRREISREEVRATCLRTLRAALESSA
ncbi:TetR/AcrR family transcriptional regulator [Sciscionella marina]|uniref:TetR/AcrR family transcriptional regulator n=1 Tax=Sciscionella marina TaxID=508770 RepID=UPI001F08E87A|nr:TetR/AcrR family transcriptional regulator [Sciscionella marina]